MTFRNRGDVSSGLDQVVGAAQSVYRFGSSALEKLSGSREHLRRVRRHLPRSFQPADARPTEGGTSSNSSGRAGLRVPNWCKMVRFIMCLPVITCGVLALSGIVALAVAVGTLASPFYGVSVEWSTPRSFVLDYIGAASAFYAESFTTELAASSVNLLPVDVYLMNARPALNSSDRVRVVYPDRPLNTGQDYRYFSFYLQGGSHINLTAYYASSSPANSMSYLVLSSARWSNFVGNATRIFDSGNFLYGDQMLPNQPNTYSWRINTASNGDLYYVVLYFNYRHGKKSSVSSGTCSGISVEQVRLAVPARASIVRTCRLAANNAASVPASKPCASPIDWKYAMYRTDLSSLGSNRTMAGVWSTETLSYEYKANRGRVAGVIIGVMAALLAPCVLTACVCGCAVLLVTLKRSGKLTRSRRTRPSFTGIAADGVTLTTTTANTRPPQMVAPSETLP